MKIPKKINTKTVRPAVDELLKNNGFTVVQRNRNLSILSKLISRYNKAVLELETVKKSVECHKWTQLFK